MAADATRIDSGPAPLSGPLIHREWYMDGLLTRVLRMHFARVPLEGYPGCEALVWYPDERSGSDDSPVGLRIEPWSTWNPARAGSSPSLIIRAGDLGSVRLGIADRHQGTWDAYGRENYSRAWVGSHRLFAISRLDGESRILAAAAAEHLLQLADSLRKVWCLSRLQIQQVAGTRPLREAPQLLASVISIEYAFIESWEIMPVASRLKRIQVETRSGDRTF